MCIERDNNSSIKIVHGCVYASEKCAYAFSLALVFGSCFSIFI
jgi:hypothetical protein